MSPGWMGEVSSPGSPLGRMLPLGGAPRVRPGLAATGPLLREGARSEKQEERRKKKEERRKKGEEAERQKPYRGGRFPAGVTGNPSYLFYSYGRGEA